MIIEKILVIDDEELIGQFIKEGIEPLKIDVEVVSTGKAGLALLKSQDFDLVFCDLKMPDISGMEVLRKCREVSPQTLTVIITGYGTIENAVEAMQSGAFHYIIKPFSIDTLETVITKAKTLRTLVEENKFLRRETISPGGSLAPMLIGESKIMKALMKDVEQVAKSQASVLIQGESGTGKEMIAQAIHDHSLRASKPFIKVNCAAIPETLIESEFFGHEKGAFTGANQKRLGRFELAHEGSLLLDEVTETPAALQKKLLRAVQEGEFDRVGGMKPVKVDVRIISTTNRNVQEAIAEKCFREDLYYRLNVVPLYVPPLREHPEDILPLTAYFLARLCAENHKKLMEMTKAAEQKLLGYHWPGNVRELANVIERAVVMNNSFSIGPEQLFLDSFLPISAAKTLQELENEGVIEVLHINNEDYKKAAKLLGVSLKELQKRMKG